MTADTILIVAKRKTWWASIADNCNVSLEVLSKIPSHMKTINKWSPFVWRNFKALHQPTYENKAELDKVINKLTRLPPLVFAGEARGLRSRLAAAAAGEAFVLHGGDCAESFAEFSADNLRDTFSVLLQMAVILTFGAGFPVVKIGRMAGQFVKPRSSPVEEQDGKTLPSYLGDMVNSIEFNAAARKPDPERILQGYNQSAATLNLLRAFSVGGFADLHQVHRWMLEFARNTPQGSNYRHFAERISEAVGFMQACGITGETSRQMREVDFYVSHEALHLPYEEAMTRQDSQTGKWYDTGAHMLWVGNRTRGVDSAHIQFVRGLDNPLGVKIDSTVGGDELLRLAETLNPDNQAGRLTFIVRMGYDKISAALPPLLKKARREGLKVVWACDPMHGNIIKSPSGYKTRPFARITGEVRRFAAALRAEKTYFGGVHLEMTGKNVTECTGGGQKIADEDLGDRYHTHCDPRLNASQSLELAFLIADELKREQAMMGVE